MPVETDPGEVQYQLDHAGDSVQPNILAAGIVCLVAAYLAVIVRFYARIVGKAKIGKDDVFIAIALFWSTVFCVFVMVLTHFGFGRHQDVQALPDLLIQGKSFIAALSILPVATWSLKVSILLLYKRIFPTPTFTKILWATGVFTTALMLANVFSTIFECTPVGAQESNAPHTCINQNTQFTTLSFINSGLDLWILCLPGPSVWRLHTSTRRKLQITAVFLIGIIAFVASLVRAVISLNTNNLDATWDDAASMIWSMVEINLSIVSASLVTARPLFKYIKERSQNRSYRYGSSRRTLNRTAKNDGVDNGVGKQNGLEMYNGIELDTRSFVHLDSETASAENRELEPAHVT